MPASINILLRTLFVLTLLVSLPVLAIPQASRQLRVICDHLSVLLLNEPASSTSAGETTLSADSSPAESSAPPLAPPGLETVTSSGPAQGKSPGLPPLTQTAASRVRDIHQQLRQLGASYTRLEMVGRDQGAYRFQCQIPVNLSVYTRQFESTHADPLFAMEQVLAEVQVWRDARDRSNHSFSASDRRTIR